MIGAGPLSTALSLGFEEPPPEFPLSFLADLLPELVQEAAVPPKLMSTSDAGRARARA